jgi:hypothetical protein
MPERAELIAAGIESRAQPEGSNAKKEARANVDRIIGIITLKYGKAYVTAKRQLHQGATI